MLRHISLAVAATLLANPATADETCLEDTSGAQCDIFMNEYRANATPIGTTNVWKTGPFLLERYHDFRADSAEAVPTGEDVLYWDGDSAMIVPEATGPRLEIADW